MLKKILIIIFCSINIFAIPPINIFRPSDRVLMPEIWPCNPIQFTVGFEQSIKVRGFQDDFDEKNQFDKDCDIDIEKKVNVLRIYQERQNFLAALKGCDSSTPVGQLSQIFNIDDENGVQGFFKPSGRFEIPFNVMFTLKTYFDHGLSIALYLPYLRMKLSDVNWRNCNTNTTLEQNLEDNLIKNVKDLSGLDIGNWCRQGVGDLVALAWWNRDFQQNKPILNNVRVNARFGLNFPTGLKQDEDKILAMPFGNDGAWGLQFGGGLDLTFCNYLRAGLDAEFLYLFGNTRNRRIKTNCNQTDLLFFTKVPAYREFGLGQQFNVYLETILYGTNIKLNYQYLKRNDDKLFICNDAFDPFIVNSAENLQDWTAHSLITLIGYDFGYLCPTMRCIPAINAWFKWGFNGKRAILANTWGVQFTLNF